MHRGFTSGLAVLGLSALLALGLATLAASVAGTGRSSFASPAPAASMTARQVTAAAPTVLIIGDSTTVHMRPAFDAALAAQGLRATIDARSGRTTFEGRAVLAGYRPAEYDLVVVLLGANGRRATALRDIRALKALGVDVMATVQAPRQRVVNDGVRRVFRAERIAWAGYARQRGITTTDGKHYTPAAYEVRARYLAAQIARRAA